MGHSRRFGRALGTSGLPPIASFLSRPRGQPSASRFAASTVPVIATPPAQFSIKTSYPQLGLGLLVFANFPNQRAGIKTDCNFRATALSK